MAQLYGVYPYVREGLRRWGRDNIILTSKTYAYERQMALDAVDEARRALNRDVIDIFMLHEQESEHTFRGHMPALEALYDLKARGVIRAVGASTHHVAGVRAAAALGLDVIHPLLNVEGWGIVDGTREEMEDAVRDAYAKGIGVYIAKAFGGGNLHRRSGECLRYVLGLPSPTLWPSVCRAPTRSRQISTFSSQARIRLSRKLRLKAKNRRIHVEDWCVGCGNCTRHCPQGAARVWWTAECWSIAKNAFMRLLLCFL